MRKHSKAVKLFSVIICLMLTVGLFPIAANAAVSAGFDVLKTDAEGNPLAGAVFWLIPNEPAAELDYSDPGEPIEAVSNEQGIAIFSDLEDGEYTLVEVMAPAGYVCSDDYYELVVYRSAVYFKPDSPNAFMGEPYSRVTFVNEKAPVYQFTVEKTDTDGNPLAGATFSLTGEEYSDGLYFEAVSGEDGIAAFEIPDGLYILAEKSAPDGYIKSDITYELIIWEGTAYTINEDALNDDNLVECGQITFVNEAIKAPTYQFTVKKTDGDGNLLDGAVFSLTGTGNSVGNDYEAVSGKDGIAVFDVPEGFYTLAEKTAPDGYVKSDKTYEIAIWGGAVYFYNENAEGDDQYSEYEQVTFVNTAAEKPVKPAENPPTGDSGMTGLRTALILVCAVGAAGTAVYGRKRKYSEK